MTKRTVEFVHSFLHSPIKALCKLTDGTYAQCSSDISVGDSVTVERHPDTKQWCVVGNTTTGTITPAPVVETQTVAPLRDRFHQLFQEGQKIVWASDHRRHTPGTPRTRLRFGVVDQVRTEKGKLRVQVRKHNKPGLPKFVNISNFTQAIVVSDDRFNW